MIRRNRDVSRPNVNQTSSQFATVRTPNLKNKLVHAARVMAPTLVALTFASVAHAQGTMDFSGAQTLMGTFKTFAIYAGAVICFGGLIFAGIRMMSGRFQFNTANPELRIRTGSLATVEKFGEDNAITVRLDNGKTVELDGEQSRYIDYGYAVEGAQQASVDRILVTGNSNQIAEQREALTHLSPHLRDLAIYISDNSGLDIQQTPSSANIKPISVPDMPEIEREGIGISL